MTDELMALADRVEALTGPCDHAMSIEVSDAFDMETPHGCPCCNFDAALGTLSPKWAWRRLTGDSVSVYRTDPHIKPAMRFDGYHANPAAALVAASLKAKADSEAITEKMAALRARATKEPEA